MGSKRLRVIYFCAIILLIPVGLLSRRVAALPDACGDALWSMMVFCCWRIVLARKKPITIAAAALLTAFAVEFSQLVRYDWLDSFRSTFIGHMMLGQGFLWTDLVADAVGVAVMFLLAFMARKLANS